MNRKIIVSALAAIVLSLAPLAALAASDGQLVALVDLKRCLVESKRGKEVKTQFETQVAKLEEKAAELEKEARAIANEVERQGALLTDQAKKDKQERFFQIRTDLGNLDKQRNKMNEEMTLGILAEVQAVVKKIADEKGIKLVLSETGPWLLYAADSLEITDEVIKRYDAGQGK